MATTQNTYTGDGSTTDYTLTFPYLAVADVRVSLDDIGTTAFSLLNATTLRFTTAPGSGVAIRIYRVTDDANNKIVFNSGSTIKADDLNDAVNRNLYIAQETTNNLTNVTAGGISDGSLTTAKFADDAVTTVKIADDAVTTAKIADDAVTQSKIAPDSISTAQIKDNVVTEAKVSGNNGFVPTGAVFHFVASSVPAGYLKCNGDTIPNGSGTVQGVAADFSALYALVGATLPDLRGEFIRGFDDGRGVDSGRSINTTQVDQNKQHNHTATSTVTDPGHDHNIRGYSIDEGSNRSPLGIIQDDDRDTSRSLISDAGAIQNNTTGITVATTIANDGGSEARPRNVALLACIKY